MLHGCIPVVVMDDVDPVFSSILDWDAFSIRIAEVATPDPFPLFITNPQTLNPLLLTTPHIFADQCFCVGKPPSHAVGHMFPVQGFCTKSGAETVLLCSVCMRCGIAT